MNHWTELAHGRVQNRKNGNGGGVTERLVVGPRRIGHAQTVLSAARLTQKDTEPTPHVPSSREAVACRGLSWPLDATSMILSCVQM